MKNFSVLMYHAISSDAVPHGYTDVGDIVYVVDVANFEQQLKYLQKHNYKSHLISELPLKNYKLNNNIILTFDDGHISNYKVALPLLKKYGFKANFFITTKWIGTEYYMDEAQIQSLSSSGMEVGSHGHTHLFLDDLRNDEVKKELIISQEILKPITSENIITFAAPGGRLNRGYKEICNDLNIDFICTSEVGWANNYKINKIPRVAIMTNTSQKIFIDVVTCNSLFMLKNKIKYLILTGAKKILGNNLYIKIRARYL
jgi:peptidoglycan/xylan/chitin deacetylase (PgdA/CDA1 family)